MTRPDVLMVLKTTSLRHDDRVRKEIAALRRRPLTVDIAVLEQDNQGQDRTIEQGVRARGLSLWMRVLPQGRFVPVKLLELHLRCILIILRVKPKTLWIHNIEFSGLAVLAPLLKLLTGADRVVWDQHELPPDGVLRRPLLRTLFAPAMRAPDVLIAGNAERAKLLTRLKMCRRRPLVLENFADQTFGELPVESLPPGVTDWLEGDPYYLAQGGAAPRRNFTSLVDAVMTLKRRLIVVGGVNPPDLESVKTKYGAELDRYIYFYGWIDQMDMPRLIDHAQASIVLYQGRSMNTRFCAPNRLYQALARGIPVIVGNNPPLRRHAERFHVGVALTDDGKDVDGLIRAIRFFESQKEQFQKNAAEHRNAAFFERQDQVISQLLPDSLAPRGSQARETIADRNRAI